MAAPTRLTIIYDNPLDDALALTASSEVPTMPVDRLRTQQRSSIFRTTGCAAEWVKFSLSRPVRPDCFAMVNYNAVSGSGRLQLNTYDDFSGTTPVDETINFGPEFIYTIAQQPFGRYGFGGTAGSATLSLATRAVAPPMVKFFTAPTDAMMFGLITFTCPTLSDGYIKAARIYCASALTFSRNYSWKSTVDCVDPSGVIRTPDGLTFFDKRALYFKRGINLGKLTSEERYYQLMDFWLAVGSTGYFIIVLDPTTDATTRLTSYYVRLTEDPHIEDAFINQHDVVLRVDEVR